MNYARTMSYLVLIGLISGANIVYAESPTVAVFDFDIGTVETGRVKVTTNQGSSAANFESSRQTSLLTHKLIANLTSTKEVKIVERANLDAIMREVQLSQTEVISPDNAIRIGKMLGADFLIFGSISMLDPSIEIKTLPYNVGKQRIMSLVVGATIRLVKTETGKIEVAGDMQAEKTLKQLNPVGSDTSIPQKFQDEVYSDLANKLASHIINTLVPIKVATYSGNTVYLARAGLTKGSRYEVIKLGEPIRHPDDPTKILGNTEEVIAIIQVTDGLKEMSKGFVEEWRGPEQSIPEGAICRSVESDE
ncbi:CsgG/HfaB family protein [Nitrospira sp. Ecomares 2.1]